MIPQDPMILLSFLNTKLRDEYDSLESLCAGLELDPETVRGQLAAAGFFYDEGKNRFS